MSAVPIATDDTDRRHAEHIARRTPQNASEYRAPERGALR
jgi:hypothetical protein